MFCLDDGFYDIVFNVVINNKTYDLPKHQYYKPTKKIIWEILFIGVNGFIILCCIYVLIFILIPVIRYRIGHFSSKNKRLTEFREEINNTQISRLRERLTNNEA